MIRTPSDSLNLDKIVITTDYLKEVAEQLGYEMSDNLKELLDELSTLAVNTLDEGHDE